MKRWLFCVLLVLPFPVFAHGNCGQLVSDPELNECAVTQMEQADAALGATYREVLAALETAGQEQPDVIEAKNGLIEAQRLWLAFRDADCGAIYALNQGGSIRIPEYLFCMSARASRRDRELREDYLR